MTVTVLVKGSAYSSQTCSEELLGPYNRTLRLDKHFEDPELLAGQGHRAARPCDGAPSPVNHQVAPG